MVGVDHAGGKECWVEVMERSTRPGGRFPTRSIVGVVLVIKDSTRNVGSAEIGFVKLRSTDDCLIQRGKRKMGTGTRGVSRPSEVRRGQVRMAKVRPSQACVTQVRVAQIRVGQVRVGQARTV